MSIWGKSLGKRRVRICVYKAPKGVPSKPILAPRPITRIRERASAVFFCLASVNFVSLVQLGFLLSSPRHIYQDSVSPAVFRGRFSSLFLSEFLAFSWFFVL